MVIIKKRKQNKKKNKNDDIKINKFKRIVIKLITEQYHVVTDDDGSLALTHTQTAAGTHTKTKGKTPY